jgi:putative acetyltransferase
MFEIREERAEDRRRVLDLNRRTFGGDYEADLVEKLTADGLAVASLVAVSSQAIVGHILFSDLIVTVDDRRVAAVALAPMSVAPANQRQGIGGQMIREGLERVRGKDRTAVIVLGHPDYYSRFGFLDGLTARLSSPFSGSAFMALELVAGVLGGEAGHVLYPPAFGLGATRPSA